MSKPLVGHVVAGYPDRDGCLQLMRGMSMAGVAAIEVQIPFSDPIADGETIMHANDMALAGGMTTAGSFALMREADVSCAIYVMSYLQKVQHLGLEAFCKEAADSGAKGLIIPDLPYDSPEYTQLLKLVGQLELVPVLSPGMSEKRLQALLQTKPSTVYVTSQRGITGTVYTGTEELEQLITVVRSQSDATIMVGFGISTPQDVKDALAVGDMAIVGSAIIKRLEASDLTETLDYIGALIKEAA
jgi:tryptophan synthase alpha chain